MALLALLRYGMVVQLPVASLLSPTNKGNYCHLVNISSTLQRCTRLTDGVHDLECFIKYTPLMSGCTWKPGKDSSRKSYSLIVQQTWSRGNSCKLYENISNLFTSIQWYRNSDVVAEVYENRKSANCSRAAFRGPLPFRCGPPLAMTFRRHSGMLDLNVSWIHRDKKEMNGVLVQYRVAREPLQSEVAKCQSIERCSVKNLEALLTYHIEIGCETNIKCSQCPQSPTYVVPAELTQKPKIRTMDEQECERGRRMIFLSWTLLQLHDGFHVRISKASGEVWEYMNTTQPEIRLVLSYSAYDINIRAFNNASVSPPLSIIVPPRYLQSDGETSGIYVRVHNTSSFTVYWGEQQLATIKCFSVEWTNKVTKKTMFESFYEANKNYKFLTPERLEPYKQYQLSLHTRPQKDPCNLSSLNASETTYGSILFYSVEGVPISAPVILSCFNITKTSVVMTWSSIPEADLQGFLLGYAIFYSENQRGEVEFERNVTVDPTSSTKQLDGLKSGVVYQVQISGITRTGTGVRSSATYFETVHTDEYEVGTVFSFAMVVVFTATFGSALMKRAKVMLWPSVPNPRRSLTMQIMQQHFIEEYLETAGGPLEESDCSSLQIVEDIDSTLLPQLEDEKIDEDAEDGEHEDSWTNETNSGREANQVLPLPPLVNRRDYTTLEISFKVAQMGHKQRDRTT